MLIVKNLTDFRKTVETGVDPRLLSNAKRGCFLRQDQDVRGLLSAHISLSRLTQHHYKNKLYVIAMTHLFCKRLKVRSSQIQTISQFWAQSQISRLSLIVEHVKTISTMLKLNLTKRMLTGIDPG